MHAIEWDAARVWVSERELLITLTFMVSYFNNSAHNLSLGCVVCSALPDGLSHDSVSLHWSAVRRVEQVIRSTYKGEVYGLWYGLNPKENTCPFLHCDFSSIITFNKILKQHLEKVTYLNLHTRWITYCLCKVYSRIKLTFEGLFSLDLQYAQIVLWQVAHLILMCLWI